VARDAKPRRGGGEAHRKIKRKKKGRSIRGLKVPRGVLFLHFEKKDEFFQSTGENECQMASAESQEPAPKKSPETTRGCNFFLTNYQTQ